MLVNAGADPLAPTRWRRLPVGAAYVTDFQSARYYLNLLT